MSHRKKHFPCGHRGMGKYCHRCRSREKSSNERREKRREWHATFEGDPIDLRGFPERVVRKARELLKRLNAGEYWGHMRGKRLNYDRTRISVPIGRDYRLILREGPEGVVPVMVLSHEDYNRIHPAA